LRVIPQPILELHLNDPKSWGLDSAVFQLTDIYTIEPLEGRTVVVKKSILTSPTTHNQISASLQFGITPAITFGPTYTTGAIAPLFKRDTAVTLALKIGFGESGGQFLH
jgi:hypothetical protein